MDREAMRTAAREERLAKERIATARKKEISQGKLLQAMMVPLDSGTRLNLDKYEELLARTDVVNGNGPVGPGAAGAGNNVVAVAGDAAVIPGGAGVAAAGDGAAEAIGPVILVGAADGAAMNDGAAGAGYA